MRRFGHPPRPDKSYTLRPGAYAVLPRHGQLLLTFQKEPEPEFQLPGGGIDLGESSVRALHREVFEETGWTIAKPRRIGAFRRFVFMPEYDLWAEKVCILFTAFPVRQAGPPSEASHLAMWTTPEFAAEHVANPGDRHFVRTLLGLV